MKKIIISIIILILVVIGFWFSRRFRHKNSIVLFSTARPRGGGLALDNRQRTIILINGLLYQIIFKQY